MQDFTGRTVVITGAAQGIGLALARAWVDAEARVVMLDIDEDALAVARRGLPATADVATFQLDVRDRARFAEIADEVETQLGPVAILCNNAGLGSGLSLAEMTYRQWDLVLDVNLGGVVNGVQTWLPRMLERGEGHIVNTASGAGLAVIAGTEFMYHTSKYAVVGMSEALHRLLAPTGIGLTLLLPGFVATNIVQTSRNLERDPDSPAADGQADQAWDTRRALLENLGMSPEEVAEQVLAAVRGNQFYLHTDRIMAEPIAARTEALLAAMPQETEHDRRVRAAVAAHTSREA